MRFETYVKYGNRWSRGYILDAQSGRDAALMTGYLADRKVIGVRPEDSIIPIQVHRFKTVPMAHHGR